MATLGTGATEEYLTTREVAEHFRVANDTIRDWRLIGKFPNAIRPGKQWLIPMSDIRALTEEKYGEPK